MKTSNYFILALITLLLGFNVYGVLGSDESIKQSIVYQIDIKEEISPGIARQVSKALTEAKAQQADLVMVRMNTYGGLLDAADSIRTLFLNSKIPVIVFIDNNAASAGALISIACEKIYMRKGASIGAATVVTEKAEALPDKYQSYMRSMMRSTAEARGRDPRIAEAMVDPRIAIEGVNDSGKVLTLTSTEALKLNYCNGIAESEQEALALAGITNYKTILYTPTLVDRMIGWLMHPAISGVLILLMLGGLYFELQQPGIGFPLIIAVLAAVMYFAPLYLDGLAANWEILLSVIGILLIA
ncbi:MAG: S49 family peptidase, partial [Bacteroidia bacterium]|nr:S49 family peptidase [Bacteroidia bacterium]